MEKVMSTRLVAMAGAVAVCLLLATAAQEAAAGGGDDGGQKYITYPKPNVIHCQVLGNCEKQNGQGVDPTRPGKPANAYTRGCSAINQCRD